MNVQKLIDVLIEFFVNYSFQVVGAVIVLTIGWGLASWFSIFLLAFLQKRNIDITLSKFFAGVLKYVILGFALIIALGKFGLTIAPFIAALGAVSFGISFAVQGPMANYGAGMVIIITRPYVVGDTITVTDISGIVDEVTLGFTLLTDEDGVKIVVPNKKIVGEIIHNSKNYRIVEGVVGISYENDPSNAIVVIKETVCSFDEITAIPEPQVGIQEFADSAINIGYRYWVPTIKYFQLLYQVNSGIHQALKKAEITIPFPQRDINLKSDVKSI